MVGLSLSKEIWEALETNFASQTIAKTMQYKLQLHNLKKGNSTMREYLGKVKKYCDLIIATGAQLTEVDHIMHILTGLGPEYDSIMVTISSKIETWSVQDTQALLLSFESRLEASNALGINTDGSQPTLNAATAAHMNQRRFTSSNPTYRGRGGYNFRGTRGYGKGNYRGRGGRYQQGKPLCQLCHGPNHTAEKCWHRYDPNFNPGDAGNFQQVQGQGSVNRNPTLNVAQSKAVSIASSDSGYDSWWYPDSGASNHIYNDLANLSIAGEYHGGSKLHLGNGAGESITHVGSSHQGNSTPRQP